jgi:hypothetical protein
MIIPPDPSRSIVKDDGTMQEAFRIFTSDVARLGLFVGTGSPEGVVEAAQGQEYMDDTGASGAIKYIKRDSDIGGDKSQGWILI